MKSYIVYGVTGIVIVVSTICVVVLPVSSELKTMFSLPGIAGLFSLLVQGWRDQVAYERDAEFQRRQHNFDLAVASHRLTKFSINKLNLQSNTQKSFIQLCKNYFRMDHQMLLQFTKKI